MRGRRSRYRPHSERRRTAIPAEPIPPHRRLQPAASANPSHPTQPAGDQLPRTPLLSCLPRSSPLTVSGRQRDDPGAERRT